MVVIGFGHRAETFHSNHPFGAIQVVAPRRLEETVRTIFTLYSMIFGSVPIIIDRNEGPAS